jgi:uncharacterized protein YraI
MDRRFRQSLAVRSWFAVVLFVPGLAAAQPVEGVLTPVAVRPGSQTDPHISGTVISCTDSDGTHSAIHVYDLGVAGGNDTTIDPGTGIDQLSDISGNRIVYTHSESGTRAIHVYDVATHAVTVIDAQAGSDLRHAAIGANTVAWVDFSGAHSVVYVYDLAAASGPVGISFAGGEDTQPAVSPDGSRVAYTSCSGGFTGCDVIVYDVASAVSTVIGDTTTEDRNPDLSNDRLVYAETDAAGDTDIVWIGLSGAAGSGRLDVPETQLDPSISGDLVSFEGMSDNLSLDVYVLDVANDELYRLTDTPQDEILNDVSLGPDGLVRVAWSTNVGIGDNDVYAFTFSRRPPACAPQTPAQACADPAGRPLLAELSISRGHGAPESATAGFGAVDGTIGVVCIANFGTAAGWVDVNGHPIADPGAFGPEVTSIAEGIVLEGANTLDISIAGAPGPAFTVKVYGPRDSCVLPPVPPPGGGGGVEV